MTGKLSLERIRKGYCTEYSTVRSTAFEIYVIFRAHYIPLNNLFGVFTPFKLFLVIFPCRTILEKKNDFFPLSIEVITVLTRPLFDVVTNPQNRILTNLVPVAF